MNNIKNSIKLLTIAFCVMYTYAPLQATHVAGGTMTYKCLGNDRYEISMEFRRDCINGDESAPFDSLATFGVYDSNFDLISFSVADTNTPGVDQAGRFQIPLTTNDTLNEILTTECNVISGDVCIQTTTYKTVIRLPFKTGGYNIVYQRCCRNMTLNNVMDPLDTGATYWVYISDAALENCNSAPVWNDWPDIYICATDTMRYFHSATDADGDSLVYSLCVPSAGLSREPNIWMSPPATMDIPEVVWNPAYNVNNMFGGGDPLVIDPSTGLMYAVPPAVTSQYLVGVCVSEYRDGELLSTVRRDFEYNIRTCGRAPVAVAVPDAFQKCNSLEIAFENNSTSNFIPNDSLDFTWFFDFPNTTLSSNEQEPTFTFPQSGIYNVALAVSDGTCVDTAIVEIAVATENDPRVAFNLDAVNCNPNTSILLEASNSFNMQLNEQDYVWTITANGMDTIIYGQNPEYNIGPDQTVTVTLAIEGPTGCNSISTQTMDINTEIDPIVDFTLESYNCNSTTTIDLASIVSSSETIDGSGFVWNVVANGMSNPLTGANPSFDILTDQQITVTLVGTTPNGCTTEITKTFDITTSPDPVASFTYNATNCNNSTVIDLSGIASSISQTIDPNSFNWTVTPSNGNPPLTAVGQNVAIDILSDQTVTVEMQVSSAEGCTTTYTETIQVTSIPFNPTFNDVIVCPGESAVIYSNTNPNNIVTVSPQSPDLTVDANGNYIIANNTTSTQFSIVVANQECSRTGVVNVTVDSNPSFAPIADIVQCGSNTVQLNPNGNTNYVYQWTGPNLNSTEANPSVSLPSSGTFFVTISTSAFSNCFGFDTVRVERVEFPTLSLLPDDELIYCENDSIIVSATSNGTVTWLDQDGFIISNDTEILISGLEDSEIIIVESVTPEGCKTTEQLELQFIAAPDFGFAPDTDYNTCIGEEISISVVSEDQITWTTENGTILATGSTLTIPALFQDSVILITAENDLGCQYTDDIFLSTYDLPELAAPGSNDMGVCIASAFSINYDSQDSIYIYTEDGELLSDSGTVDLEGLEETTSYYIELVSSEGCVSTDSITVTVFDELGLDINAGNGIQIYCEGTSPVLNSTSNVSADIEWYVDGILVGSGDELIDYFPDGDFDIVAVGTDASGCTESDTITVIESIAEGSISGPESICLEDFAVLSYNPNENSDFIISWSPNMDIDSAGTSITVSPAETTTYVATYTNGDGCGDTTSYTLLVGGFSESPDLSAEPTEICLTQSTELSIDTDPSNSVTWSPAESLDDPTSQFPTATPTETTTYSVVITDDLGCDTESNITIDVVQPTCDEKDVFVPNMFTPNFDDLNDVFKVESIFLESMTLTVYNRWGEEVFTSEDQDIGWDGTFNGEILEPDVYGYYFSGVCVNGFTVQRQGNVTLLK